MRQKLPTTREMLDYLDIHIQGQEQAKRDLVKSVYFHYLNLMADESENFRSSSERCLLIGPTGSGKTLLAQTIARFLDVPVLYCNTPSLTSEGYVGESVSDLLARYDALCDGDAFVKTRGIICLDEFDKICLGSSSSGRGGDIGGLAVQQQLLALFDGQKLSRITESARSPKFNIDTSKILILATGAFVGIEKIVRSRTSSVGFRSHKNKLSGEGMTTSVVPEDLEKFGFIPELIGRFSATIELTELSLGDFRQILENPVQSPITAYRAIFEKHGLRLVFDDAALELMTVEAQSMGLGARSLQRLVSSSLKEVSWRLDELRDRGICEIRVGKDTISKLSSPEVIHGPPAFEYKAEELRATVFIDQRMQRFLNDSVRTQSREESPQADAGTTKEMQPNKVISNTKGWTSDQLLQRYAEVKELVGFRVMAENVATWWAAYESEIAHRPALLVRIAEELWLRGATISQLFSAFIYSNTKNIQGNLEYMNFLSERDTWEQRTTGASSIAIDSRQSAPLGEVRELLCFGDSSPAAQLFWELVEHDFYRIGADWFRGLSKVRDAAVVNLNELLDLAVRARTVSPTALVCYQRYLGLLVGEVIEEDAHKPQDEQWRQKSEGFPMMSDCSLVYRIYRLVAEEVFFIRLGRRYQTIVDRQAELYFRVLESHRLEVIRVGLQIEQRIKTGSTPHWLLDSFSEIRRRPYLGEICQPDHARGIVKALGGALTTSIPSWTPGTVVEWCEHLVASMAYREIDSLGALRLVMRVSLHGIADYWARSVDEFELLVPGARRVWNQELEDDGGL